MVVLSLAAAAQSLAPEEARFHAVPYFPRPAVTIRTKTELVEIGVVVRDSHGKAVPGLTKADFEVRDEGKRREISAFTLQNFVPAASSTTHAPSAGSTSTSALEAQPRFVAVVFDDISTPPADLYTAKAAAKRFVKEGLAANDRIGVFTTSSAMVLPFSGDASKIAEAIDKVNYRERDLTLRGCPLLTPYDAYLIANNLDSMALNVKAQELDSCAGICGGSGAGTRRGRGGTSSVPPACEAAISQVQGMSRSLWEQVRMQSQNNLRTLDSVVDFMTRLQGARVILLASSGFLSGTLEYDQDLITYKALRANVVINSLDAKGLYSGLFTADQSMGQGAGLASAIYHQQQGTRPKEMLNDALGNLADATGGRFFHNRNDLDAGFKELGMQPEVVYLLGIAPEALDARYHHLKVTLTPARHLSIQARKGYVASPEMPKQQDPPAERRMDSEVFNTNALQETPVTISTSSDKSPDGQQLARLTFHVDIGKVQFHEQDGVRTQKFRMIATLFDFQGTFVKGVEGELDFALKPATYEQFMKPGFFADLRLGVPAGSYRLRTVVVEGDDNGRYSTASQSAEFH